jgi:hypothetical protein
LTDEINREPIESEEADGEYCKEDEEEGGGAIHKTILSEQDMSGIEEKSDFI